MIKELCPDGVPFKTLGEIGEFVRGNGMRKSDLVDEGVPAIHYGQIHTHYGDWAAETISFVTPELGARLRKATCGDLVIATTSEDDEAVAKAVAWLGDVDAAVSGDAYIFRHTLDPKYIAYFFQSDLFRSQKARSITGTKVRRISGEHLARIRVPVPPIKVQQEVVRTLDSFASLESQLKVALQSELESRMSQFVHYRDGLLTFSGSRVPTFRMGELADFKYGFTASAADSGEFRLLRITDINSWGKLLPDGAKYVASTPQSREYLVEPGDLLMARTGATYGKTMLVASSEPSVYASFLIRIRFKEPNVLPAYYWHFAQSSLYWSQANAMVSTGGQPQFNANALKLVKVPIPPIEEQQRIINVLDTFDTLVNDLSLGLPAELAARRQQYKFGASGFSVGPCLT
jgi:type I restriction enzyme S subunit